jgi:hypothetical protein
MFGIFVAHCNIYEQAFMKNFRTPVILSYAIIRNFQILRTLRIYENVKLAL